MKEGLDIWNCYINILLPASTYQFSDNNLKGSTSRLSPFLLLLSQLEQFLEFSVTVWLMHFKVFTGY